MPRLSGASEEGLAGLAGQRPVLLEAVGSSVPVSIPTATWDPPKLMGGGVLEGAVRDEGPPRAVLSCCPTSSLTAQCKQGPQNKGRTCAHELVALRQLAHRSDSPPPPQPKVSKPLSLLLA